MTSAHGTVVAIVGGGASGTIVAAHLLGQSRTVRVILIDRTDHGPGVAYSTTDPQHLLNVRAGGMSAFEHDPDDLLRWCAGAGIRAGADDFIPRHVYGDYLRSLLVRCDDPDRLELVRGTATEVSPRGDSLRVMIDGRSSVSADAVVLALGNPPPAPAPGVTGAVPYVGDPWSAGAPEELARVRRIGVVGTGMTAVDVVLTATARNPGVQICAVSRHGWLPRAHLPAVGGGGGVGMRGGVSGVGGVGTRVALGTGGGRASAPIGSIADLRATDLAAAMGEALARDTSDWRQAIDALRPRTQELWQAMTVDERRSFLKRHKSRWDIHRHRMAPPVAARIDELVSSGQLRVLAGTIQSATVGPRGVAIALRRGDGTQHEYVDLVVNATGPSRRIEDSSDPLIRAMLSRGQVTPDDIGIGLACDGVGHVIAAGGEPDRRIFTLGPPRRGELLESTAIPEIRAQAAAVSRQLMHLSAHVTTSASAPNRAAGHVIAARRRSAAGHIMTHAPSVGSAASDGSR